jgi:hypothetical protein
MPHHLLITLAMVGLVVTVSVAAVGLSWLMVTAWEAVSDRLRARRTR